MPAWAQSMKGENMFYIVGIQGTGAKTDPIKTWYYIPGQSAQVPDWTKMVDHEKVGIWKTLKGAMKHYHQAARYNLRANRFDYVEVRSTDDQKLGIIIYKGQSQIHC